MKRRTVVAVWVSSVLSLGTVAPGALTGTAFTYQGQLKQGSAPVSGPADLQFSLWDAPGSGDPPTGGTQIGGTQSVNAVAVSGGLFSVELNAGGEFGPTAFNGDARWLQITVRSPAGSGTLTTLAPRQPITAAPYALHALNAVADGHSLDAADGSPLDALFVDNSGNVGIGTTSPGRRLDVDGNATIRGSMFFNTASILEIAHENNTGMRIDPTSNSVQLETDGSVGITVTSSRNVGIGTSAPLYPLHVETSSSSGRGVFGYASAPTGTTHGGYFQTQSTGGVGAFGYATASTGTTSGLWGQSDSTSGRGVYGLASKSSGTTYGVYGRSDSTSGTGVFGEASTTSGVNYGGRFQTASLNGRAVYGSASAASGYTYGGYFRCDSPDGCGVRGVAASTGGGTGCGVYGESSGTVGRGVLGVATADGASDTPYAVRGECSLLTAGYAVYALGDMAATGTKSFRIDHPSDPENKYLLHYSAESPEVINFYSGNVTLGERGEATVDLPAYFASINKDPRYTLTAVGAPMPNLHVAEEISDKVLKAAAEQARPGAAPTICSFRIAGGVPNARVSWEVKAVRNDLRMRAHHAPVEREKPSPERGRYQHPELYGQPHEKGIDWHEDHGTSPAVDTQRTG